MKQRDEKITYIQACRAGIYPNNTMVLRCALGNSRCSGKSLPRMSVRYNQ